MEYKKPIITSMLIDMNKTDVLAGCQGWKDGIAVDLKAVLFNMNEVNEIKFMGEGSERFMPTEGIVRRTIQSINVLVPVKGTKKDARIFLLNATAAMVWDLSADGKSLSEIISEFESCFKNISKGEDLKEDVQGAIEQLVQLDLLSKDS